MKFKINKIMKTITLLLALGILLTISCNKEKPKPEIIINHDFLVGKKRHFTGIIQLNPDGTKEDITEFHTALYRECYFTATHEYTATKYIQDYECGLKDSENNWIYNEDSTYIYNLYYNPLDTIKYKIVELSENILKVSYPTSYDSTLITYSSFVLTYEVIEEVK